MNIYCTGRSFRPAGLFSFGLLDGPPEMAVSKNGRLTISPARTDMALFILRAVRLDAPGRGAVQWVKRLSWQAQGGG